MRFAPIVSLLALISIAASQVVVTETHTVTVITITVSNTPESTSTSTVFLTVPGTPTTTQWTSTTRVTITAPAQPTGQCPVPDRGQCGGQGYYGCTTCQGRHVCRSVSPQYSQCHDPKANVAVVTALVYDGIVAEK